MSGNEPSMVMLDGEMVAAEGGLAAALVVEVEAGVPLSVSRAQAMHVMAGHILSDGRALDTATEALLAEDLEAVADLPDSDEIKIAAKRAAHWWRNAQTFERAHPILIGLQLRFAHLGLSPEAVDQLFRDAAEV